MYKLTLILFAFLSLVFPILADPVPVPNEIDGLAQRDATAGAGTSFTGNATSFDPGLGACGTTNTSDQFVAAISANNFGTGAHCGQKVEVGSLGTEVQATVVDKCTTVACGDQDIEMSPAAFQALADQAQKFHPGASSVKVTWNFV